MEDETSAKSAKPAKRLLRISDFCNDRNNKANTGMLIYRRMRRRKKEKVSSNICSNIADAGNTYTGMCIENGTKRSHEQSVVNSKSIAVIPETCHREKNSDESVSLAVSISILSSIPFIPNASSRQKQNQMKSNTSEPPLSSSVNRNVSNHKKSKPKQNIDKGHFVANNLSNDIFATVYAENADILLAMQVFDGQLCKLVSIHGHESRSSNTPPHIRSTSQSWAPVILKILTNKSFLKSETSSINNPLVHNKQRPTYHIYVPPSVAARIGIFEFSPRSLLQGASISPLYNFSSFLYDIAWRSTRTVTNSKKKSQLDTSFRPTPAVAIKASLREIGIPPSDFIPTFEAITSLNNPSYKREQIMNEMNDVRRRRQTQQLQKYFYQNGKKEKPAYRLANCGSVIAIVDRLSRGNISGKNTKSLEQGLSNQICSRFYKVVSMKDANGIQYNDTSSETGGCLFLSPDTELLLLPRSETENPSLCTEVQRLPQESLVQAFDDSVNKRGKSDSIKVKIEGKYSRMNSHPSVDMVARALMVQGSGSVSPSCRSTGSLFTNYVLHVVGHEDNNVKACLDAAADIVGARILHIHGLAAFSFRYNAVYSGEKDSLSTMTGSIMDKLSGLSRAFKIARKCAPCILHVRLDGEFINVDDGNIRHDEEDRFLLRIKQELSLSTNSNENTNVRYSNELSPLFNDIPRVSLILSTSKRLPEGPLRSRLAHEALDIIPPDEKYARELWGDNKTFEEVKAHLIGRSSAEIAFLRHKFRTTEKRKKKSDSKSTSTCVKDCIELLMRDLDEKSSPFLGYSASNLSSSLIPDVRWEDVGGLSHVRDEVMNAIELPLEHPKLFRGSKRSGILFFGPPGSGKTLVAKAIATECGLPFLSVKGPELLGSYVGESEANVRAAFASAREAAASAANRSRGGTAILFFDEIDSIAPKRGGVGDGGGVMERVVATLLGELDKDETDSQQKRLDEVINVFVIGATNRPDLLDPALLRPGRFDVMVYLGLAKSRNDRICILAAQTRKFSFKDGMDSFSMASQVIDSIPESLSGADFSAVASGALTRSLKRQCEKADVEVSRQDENILNLEGVTAELTEEHLVPTVTADDIILAAMLVNPSVDQRDLKTYETLKEQFCGK